MKKIEFNYVKRMSLIIFLTHLFFFFKKNYYFEFMAKRKKLILIKNLI